MRGQVVQQRCLGYERIAARIAIVRLDAQVLPAVYLQRAVGGKRLAARDAAVRFFARMRPLVRHQRGVRGKRIFARLADVNRIVARVAQNVFHQTVLTRKRLIAQVALKTWGLFFVVHPGGVHRSRLRRNTSCNNYYYHITRARL